MAPSILKAPRLVTQLANQKQLADRHALLTVADRQIGTALKNRPFNFSNMLKIQLLKKKYPLCCIVYAPSGKYKVRIRGLAQHFKTENFMKIENVYITYNVYHHNHARKFTNKDKLTKKACKRDFY